MTKQEKEAISAVKEAFVALMEAANNLDQVILVAKDCGFDWAAAIDGQLGDMFVATDLIEDTLKSAGE